MNVFKRVWISITRRKTATLIFFLFTFLMGNVLICAESIAQSGENTQNHLLNRIGGKIVLTDTSLFSDAEVTGLTLDEYRKKWTVFEDCFKALTVRDHVAYADINYHINFMELSQSEEYELDENISYENGFSILHGISYANLADEKEGFIQLTGGEIFTDRQMENGDNVLIVNEDIKKNSKNIKVGDTIDFVMNISAYDSESNEMIDVYHEIVTYTVVGTFKIIENKYSDVKNIHNIQMFYTPNRNIQKLAETYLEMNPQEDYVSKIWIDSALIAVDQPQNVKSLEMAANNYVEGTDIIVTTSNDSVSNLLGPIDSFSGLAHKTVIFSIAAMCIIAALISFYFIKDRKHEIGIYLSMGIKRSELFFQIILEVILSGLLGIVISFASGWFLSQNLSRNMMRTAFYGEMSVSEKYTDVSFYLNPDQIDQQDILDEYVIMITVDDFIWLIGLSVGTFLISSLLPLLYVIRLKPKDIMLE